MLKIVPIATFRAHITGEGENNVTGVFRRKGGSGVVNILRG